MRISRRCSAIFAQLIAAPAPLPQLIVLPEAALTGYFLEGGVYELAFTADAFAERLNTEWIAAGGKATVDVVCGFYENDGGTYHNSALYVTLGGAGCRRSSTCIARCSCRRTACSMRNAFSRAAAS